MENPGITLPVNSGLKANCGRALARRKVIKAGEQVNVDVSGVFNRYHGNAGRAFHVGEPAKDVMEYHRLSAGVFDVIADILRPNLPVTELVKATRAYYDEVGVCLLTEAAVLLMGSSHFLNASLFFSVAASILLLKMLLPQYS